MGGAINNKRIAKNTLFLYLRMLILIAINLYVSRVVLDALGVVDYGIYNVVGSFVVAFSMVNAALTTATQRFLSFQIARGDNERVQHIFSTSFLLHLCLALIILLLAETLGLWFLNNKMQIPHDRCFAANIVYHFSVFSLVLKVISLPYNAAIIAYEKMSTFAYISIIEALLSLFIVFILYIVTIDKLIVYSLLVGVVSIIIQLIYWLYVKRKLGDTCFVSSLYKSEAKERISFVSYNVLGASTAISKEQGISIILNMFFGATINTARGIAIQLRIGLNRVVSNFTLAMNPQIVKSYSIGDERGMSNLIVRGSKFSYLLLLLLSTPIFVQADIILDIWLVNVPDLADIFLRIMILSELVDSLQYTLVTGVLATGKVKAFQLTMSILRILCLPVAYILLNNGFPAIAALYTSLAFSIICHVANVILLARNIQFPCMYYFKEVTIRMFLLTIICLMISHLLSKMLNFSILMFMTFVVLSLMITASICFLLGLNKSERIAVITIVKKLFIK